MVERLPLNVGGNLGRISAGLTSSVSVRVSSSPPPLLSFLPKLEFSKGNQLKRCLVV